MSRTANGAARAGALPATVAGPGGVHLGANALSVAQAAAWAM